MPKQKTRKSAAKRFKVTGTGKYRRHKAGGRHILTKKTGKRKRKLGQDAPVSKGDARRIDAALPHAK
jgi:large subunit ribosomal protein L35